MLKKIGALGLCTVSFVACVAQGTSGEVAIDGVASAVARAEVYLVAGDERMGNARALVAGVELTSHEYIGLGVQSAEGGVPEDGAEQDVLVFLERGTERLDGVCKAVFSGQADDLTISVEQCRIGTGASERRLDLTFDHAGEIPEIAFGDVGSILPSFGVYAREAEGATGSVSTLPQPPAGAGEEALSSEEPGYHPTCYCTQSCDYQLMACLAFSVSCGGFYTLCAGACLLQQSQCIGGCAGQC